MSIKQQAHEIIDQLPEDANWDDLVKSLYRNKKITLGLTDLEVVQDELSEAELSSIITRLHSSSSRPDDMRDTRKYNPGNAATLGMVSGVIAVFTAFVFPPISWVAAGIAAVSGLVGVQKKEPKAWVAVLLAVVSILPLLVAISGAS